MMIELASVSATIDAHADRIWALLMDFGHPERLAPSINSTELIGEGLGAVRIVTSSRGLEIHEKLVECDRAQYRFRYAILDTGDMPFQGVTSYDCTVVLTPLGDARTGVVWASRGEVHGPIAPISTFLGELYVNAITRIAAHLDD